MTRYTFLLLLLQTTSGCSEPKRFPLSRVQSKTFLFLLFFFYNMKDVMDVQWRSASGAFRRCRTFFFSPPRASCRVSFHLGTTCSQRTTAIIIYHVLYIFPLLWSIWRIIKTEEKSGRIGDDHLKLVDGDYKRIPPFFVIFCSLAAIERPVRFAIFLYFDMLSTTDGSTF